MRKLVWLVLWALCTGLEARIERVGDGGFSLAESQAIAALPNVPADLNKGYLLERKPSKQVDCKFQQQVTAPKLVAKDWIFYAAKAPNLSGQTVTYVKSNPHGKVVVEPSLERRGFLAIAVSGRGKAKQSADIRVYTGAQLFSRKLKKEKVANQVKPLLARERKMALRPTDFYNYADPKFLTWVNGRGLARKAEEGEVDFGRRVFQDIARNFQYEYTNQMERSANRVYELGQSDCGGLSVLFVTVMRSQGIPARCLCGRWAQSAKVNEQLEGVPYFQNHVKAEFFAQGVGWVPVDVSSAVLHDKTQEKLKYYGNDEGDFLTVHIDHGVSLDSRYFGVKRLDWLQGIAYWATGSGSFEGSKVERSWEVK